jgi:hypothetical protein
VLVLVFADRSETAAGGLVILGRMCKW